MAITLKISANRLKIVDLFPTAISYGLNSGIFKPRQATVAFRQMPLSARMGTGACICNGARVDIANPVGLPESFTLVIQVDRFHASLSRGLGQ
jgi:hypothetical protein